MYKDYFPYTVGITIKDYHLDLLKDDRPIEDLIKDLKCRNCNKQAEEYIEMYCKECYEKKKNI